MKVKRKMYKIAKKQIRKHYFGELVHDVCLTCKAIVATELLLEIVDDLEYLDILQPFEIDEKRAVILKKWVKKLNERSKKNKEDL